MVLRAIHRSPGAWRLPALLPVLAWPARRGVEMAGRCGARGGSGRRLLDLAAKQEEAGRQVIVAGEVKAFAGVPGLRL